MTHHSAQKVQSYEASPLAVFKLGPWPAELSLLIDFTRNADDPVLIETLNDEVLLAGIDWPLFEKLAGFHRVENLVYDILQANPNLPVPARMRETLSHNVRQHIMRQMRNDAELAKLSAQLQNLNLKHVLMKGAYVAKTFYRAPHMRQSIDMDLWIAVTDIGAVSAVIIAMGYVQIYPQFDTPDHCESMLVLTEKSLTFANHQHGTMIDLHWRFHRNSKWLAWDFNTEYAKADHVQIMAIKVPVLSRLSHIYYIYFHGAKSGWFRLKWMADIYRINQALTLQDAAAISQRASHENMQRMLGTSLALCRGLYPESYADDLHAFQAIKPDVKMLKIMTQKILRSRNTAMTGQKEEVNMREALSYRLRFQPGLSNKFGTLFNAWLNPDLIKTLRLSKKWLWLYCLIAPVIFMSGRFKPD